MLLFLKRRRGKGGESGKEDEKGESLKKSKVFSSRRREEGDGEEVRKSSSGKYREFSRREFDKDKDNKKYKESKSDKFYDGDDYYRFKGFFDKFGKIIFKVFLIDLSVCF